MKVIPEFMEPLFKYAGHGSAGDGQDSRTWPQCMEIDLLGRDRRRALHHNPDYRRWWHGLVEEHAATTTSTASCGATSATAPLDRMMQGQAPGCFCPHCRREAAERGIDVERVRIAFGEVWDLPGRCATGKAFVDGALIGSCACCCATPRYCSGSGSGWSGTRILTASSTGSPNGATRRCPSG